MSMSMSLVPRHNPVSINEIPDNQKNGVRANAKRAALTLTPY